jgi:hypothetical protein
MSGRETRDPTWPEGFYWSDLEGRPVYQGGEMSSAMSLPLHAYNLPDDLLRFAHALQEADGFAGDISNVLYFFEKPWKWESEYESWRAAGSPSDHTDGAWDAFVEAVESK